MSRRSKQEVLGVMRLRYAGRGRVGRSRLLDEFCELCRYERKYAIKLLRGQRRREGKVRPQRGGAKPKYGTAEREVLKEIWLGSEQPCGKRLQPAVALWLPDYEREHGPVEGRVRERLLQMSPATMDTMPTLIIKRAAVARSIRG